MPKIQNIRAREVIDSRGFPTLEAEVFVNHSKTNEIVMGRAIVPSGASTGEFEALELRDGDAKRFKGKGVLKAIHNLREKIAPALINRSFEDQASVDKLLCELDGTPNKSSLGANAILGVSMAYARACSQAQGTSILEFLSSNFGSRGQTLPVPLMNILNGGKHADNGLAIQEFMIVPLGLNSFSDALRAGCEIFHELKKILKGKDLSTGVGDEGGFAPVFQGRNPHSQALSLVVEAISSAGYRPGKDIFLALDAAASEFAVDKVNYSFEGEKLTSNQMVQVYEKWVKEFPIVSIEDGLSEHDWDGWSTLTKSLGQKCQLVGDDLFVTNPQFLKKGIEKKVGNSILIKLNQIGTVTETLDTMKMAHQAKYSTIVSHRSGESEDTFIADLAVATDAGQIKTGSVCRTDRVAKYNQLLRIEENLGSRAKYAGAQAFSRYS